MKKYLFLTVLLFAMMQTAMAFAQSPVTPAWDQAYRISSYSNDPRTHFRTESVFALPESPVPVVVDVPLEVPRANEFEGNAEILVIDANGIIVPSYVKQTYEWVPPVPYTVSSNIGDGAVLVDNNMTTGITYPLPIDTRQGVLVLTITPQRMTKVSGIAFTFGQNTITPASVEVHSLDSMGNETILLSRTSLYGSSVQFIPTNSSGLTVYMEYTQPVRIQELKLTQETEAMRTRWSARFLAQPSMMYTLYSDPDTYVDLPHQDVSNLTSDTGVVEGQFAVTSSNSRFRPADADGDTIPDAGDNCPSESNQSQDDINGNGIGDACDDYDRDGYINTKDNCPNVSNYQRDEDGDGVGDECDGEESRFTERLPWVPWVGMGIAGFVLLGLFIFVGIDMRKRSADEVV